MRPDRQTASPAAPVTDRNGADCSPLARACARRATSANCPHTRDNHAPSPPGQCDGSLSPQADPVTGELGWRLATTSRQLAETVAAALPDATAHCHGKRNWQTLIPQPFITVTLVAADPDALWCRLDAQPDSGLFAVPFAPWPAAAVLKSRPLEFPARGQLSVLDVCVTTRMGRTVRYLIPEFTPV